MFKISLLIIPLCAILAGLAFAQMPKTPAVRGTWGLQTVDAESAWSNNASDVVVAVIDTGADLTHPDLRAALWTNPGESGVLDHPKCRDARYLQSAFCDKSRNGVDDDGNGFVDDVHGWNFAGGNDDLTDNAGHGTHIAGIIGATGDYGLRGVAPNARMMILKYTDPKTSGDPLINTIRAIEYATRMGAKIINYSAGGKRPSRLERDAIAAAGTRGILFIAAAGNEGSDSDLSGYFPADYDLPNILSVTAVDPTHKVLKTSNYGARSVSVAAPGEKILSTVPGGRYGMMTGTSQATAFATGIAALLLGNRRGAMSPRSVAEVIALSGVTQKSLKAKTRSETLVNAKRALVMHDQATSASGVVVEEMRVDAKLLEAQL
jgi:thermitase